MGFKDYDINKEVRYEDPDNLLIRDLVQDLHFPKPNDNNIHETPLHNYNIKEIQNFITDVKKTDGFRKYPKKPVDKSKFNKKQLAA